MRIIDEYIKDLERELKKTKMVVASQEIGIVNEVKDGVVLLSGLDNVAYGELIEFEKGEEIGRAHV